MMLLNIVYQDVKKMIKNLQISVKMLIHYNKLKWGRVYTMDRLETDIFCFFCKTPCRAYYHDQLTYPQGLDHYRYYLCEDAYQDVSKPRSIILIYHLIQTQLCSDLKPMILIMMCDHVISCIEKQKKAENDRDDYLNYDFENLSLKQLQQLTIKRKLVAYKCRTRNDYINVLRNDVQWKSYEWRWHKNDPSK